MKEPAARRSVDKYAMTESLEPTPGLRWADIDEEMGAFWIGHGRYLPILGKNLFVVAM